MADTKISALTSATLPLSGSELVPIVQSGTTVKTAISNIASNQPPTPYTTNGVVYASSTSALTTGSGLQFDGTNLGVGVTPSAWGLFKAVELPNGAHIASYTGGVNILDIGLNYYFNGASYIYNTSDYAEQYVQRSGEHRWYNAPSGTAGNAITFTQAMTLDVSGNLIVGGTSALGNTTNRGNITLNGTSSALYSLGVGGVLKGFLNHGGTNLELQNTANGILSFSTNATEAMRLTSAGNLLVGTTSAFDSAYTMSLKVSGATGGLIIQPGSDNYTAIQFNNAAGVGKGSISVSSTATTYNITSDYRLKNVIGAVTGHGARIDALEPIEYEWKETNTRTRGFLAHKFQEVYADSVTGAKDAVNADGNPVYQAMQAATSEVIADLVAEIQSLRKRILTLENK